MEAGRCRPSRCRGCRCPSAQAVCGGRCQLHRRRTGPWRDVRPASASRQTGRWMAGRCPPRRPSGPTGRWRRRSGPRRRRGRRRPVEGGAGVGVVGASGAGGLGRLAGGCRRSGPRRRRGRRTGRWMAGRCPRRRPSGQTGRW